MHTVFLGRDGCWIELSLPWLARDLARLVAQIRGGTLTDPADSQRISALRLVMARLEAESAPRRPCATSVPVATSFHRDAEIVHAGSFLPERTPIVYACAPTDTLELEHLLDKRHPASLLSVIVHSASGVIVGPVLESAQYCSLCLRYLAGASFGLERRDGTEEQEMLNLGLALARTIKRQARDTIIFQDDSLKVQPFVPFVGCPTCIEAT